MAVALGLPALGVGWTDPAVTTGWPNSWIAYNHWSSYASHPWRAWTTVWVHLSALHLAANLLGLVLIAALGLKAGVRARSAWAWCLAWPCTNIALLAVHGLDYCVGLSGVLHAGVAVVVVHLLLDTASTRTMTQRLVGGMLGAGLAAKIVLEHPWSVAVVQHPALGLPVVPAAHLSGAICGTTMALLLHVVPKASTPGFGYDPAVRKT